MKKNLFKSEQGEVDAVCHILSVMYMPFADLRDQYSCTIDKQIWWKVFASMTQRPASVDLFENHFQYASSIHRYNRYASQQNLCKP